MIRCLRRKKQSSDGFTYLMSKDASQFASGQGWLSISMFRDGCMVFGALFDGVVGRHESTVNEEL